MRNAMKRVAFLIISILTFVECPMLAAQGLSILDAIQQAHGSPVLAPITVQMIGVVERGGKTEPFQIVATRDEELRIEYGNLGKDVLVLSQKLNFHDDGSKVAYQKVPAGFSQLDITGVFFVQQLRNRAVHVENTGERTTLGAVSTQRLRVQSERSQLHKGSIKVNDQVDVYVTDSGLLAGISRGFYEGRPERYTQAFAFSDYRKVNGELLPYRIDVYIKGQKRQTFLIENYSFDIPADRDLFIARRVR